jgi:glycerophosphoryl diester phosphodiesterase
MMDGAAPGAARGHGPSEGAGVTGSAPAIVERSGREMDWIAERPIAHRGLHDASLGVPENSAKAFAAAAEEGYPIELDVHWIKDGNVAVFHDFSLDRMTGRPGSILNETASSLRALRLAGTDQPIPLLGEVLELVGGAVPVVIEIKNRGRVGGLEKAVRDIIAGYIGQIAVVSFNPFSLGWFRRNAPEIPRGQSAGDARGVKLAVFQKFLQRNLLLNAVSRPHFINNDLRCLPYWAVTRLRSKGLTVVTWTVRSEADAAKARAVADNFMFERIRP